jgi:hypothetical protein
MYNSILTKRRYKARTMKHANATIAADAAQNKKKKPAQSINASAQKTAVDS